VRAGNIGGLLAKTSLATSSTGATSASTFFCHYGSFEQFYDETTFRPLGSTLSEHIPPLLHELRRNVSAEPERA
jgi:hypothetical protein